MRTTIEFNNFLFQQVRQLQAKSGKTLSETVNDLVHKALGQSKSTKFVDFSVKAKKLGTIPGLDYSNTEALLERAEGIMHK